MNFLVPIIIWVITWFSTIFYFGYRVIILDIFDWYSIPMILGIGVGGAIVSIIATFSGLCWSKKDKSGKIDWSKVK